jgi:hypothetical protein
VGENIKMDLREKRLKVWLDSSGSGQVSVPPPCEHGNELSSSIKGGEFLDRVIIRFSRMSLLYGVSSLVSYPIVSTVGEVIPVLN